MSSEFQAALERKRNRLAAEGIAAGAAATGNRGYIQSKLKFGGRPPPSVVAPADGSEDDDFVQPRTKKHKVQPESGAPHSGGVPIARRTRSSPQSAVRRAPPRAPDDKKGRPVRKREVQYMKTLKIFSFFFVWLNMGSIDRGTHNFVADAQRSRASLSGGQAPRSTKEGRAKKRGKNCELLCMSIFFPN